MTDAPAAPKLGFIDNPSAPDVFADSATGFFFLGGNLRITLESVRVNHETTPGPINRVVIGRLVMPVQAAEGLARGILDFLDRQKAAPTANAQGTATIQ